MYDIVVLPASYYPKFDPNLSCGRYQKLQAETTELVNVILQLLVLQWVGQSCNRVIISGGTTVPKK